MTEQVDPVSPDRRANWVGLRTLRQRPTVVGQTADGKTVFEVRSVRLVLGAGAPYFHRLVRCAKCGSELVGPAVVTQADLEQPTNPRVCDRCVRSATPPSPAPRRRPEEAPKPVPPADPVEPAPAVADNSALVEAKLSEIAERLAALAGVEERVAVLSQRVEAVAQDQQGRLRDMAASVGDIRAQVERAAESNQRMAQAHEALRERTSGLADQVAAGPSANVEANLAATLDAERRHVQAALDAGLGALESRINEQVSGWTGVVDALRRDFEEALRDAVQQVLGATAEPLRDLAEAREETRSTLASLQREAQDRDDRMRALEEKLDGSVRRLTDLVAARAERSAPARPRPHRPVPPVTYRGEGGLLGDLDRQLMEAEGRLAEHDRAPLEGSPPASR